MPSLILQALHFGNIFLVPLLEVLNTLFSQPSPSKTLSVGSFYRKEHGKNETQAPFARQNRQTAHSASFFSNFPH